MLSKILNGNRDNATNKLEIRSDGNNILNTPETLLMDLTNIL